MAFENNDYFTFGPPIIGGGYGGTYGGGIYGQIAQAAETLPPGPVVPGAVAQPAPAPAAPPNPQVGVTELPPPSSNDPAPLPNPLGETAEEVFETFPPGVFPELYGTPPFPFPEIEADYRRYTEENYDLHEFCGDYGLDPVDCALIGNSDPPRFGPGALEPDPRDVDTRTQEERWRDELRIPPLRTPPELQRFQPSSRPKTAPEYDPFRIPDIGGGAPRPVPVPRRRTRPRRRPLEQPRRRRTPRRRPEPDVPIRTKPLPFPFPLPLPRRKPDAPKLPAPVPLPLPRAPAPPTPPEFPAPDEQTPVPQPFPPVDPEIGPVESPERRDRPAPLPSPSPARRSVPRVWPWPFGSPSSPPGIRPFIEPFLPQPSAPPVPNVPNPLTPIDASTLPFAQPRLDSDPCNCAPRRRSRKRECHGSAPVRWAGGPLKGELAGNRCYSFKQLGREIGRRIIRSL